MSEDDCAKSATKPTTPDPQDEVRKLQDLVRKLEQQNQQLRVKQSQIMNQQRNSRETTPTSGRTSSSTSPAGVDLRPVVQMSPSPEPATGMAPAVNNNGDSVLDDVELIDVDQLDLTDEDSWLFSSPHLSAEQRAVNPYLWLRMDVEDPGNSELQSVKKALVSKIEELARVSNLYASPVQFLQAARRCQLSPDDTIEPPHRLRPTLNCKLSLGPSPQREFDSRTFTRPKRSSRSLGLPVVEGADVSPLAPHPATRDENRSCGPSTPPLNDVIDIHTLARLQEENLRQCSPPSTPRRNSVASSSSQRSGLSPVLPSDHDAQEWVSGNGTYTSTGSESMVEGSPQAQSSRGSSTSASPSVSPRGSQYFEDGRNSSGLAKRVMPQRMYNGVYAVRGAMNNHHHPIQRLQKSQANFVEPVTITGSEQAPRIPRYSGSPVRQPNSGNGTPRSSSPATRGFSSIPVRNSPPISEDEIQAKAVQHSSRIPKPRTRSAIPMLQRSRASNNYEDSWKEGCY